MNVRARLTTLISVRVVLSTLLLGSSVFLQMSRPGALASNSEPLFFLIGLTYALSVVYFLTLRFVERLKWLADVQLCGDALLVSGFIAATGGITSYFSSLYLLPIIAASTLRYRRGAMQVATLSAVLYLGLVAAQYIDIDLLHAWVQLPSELPTLRFAQYTVAINLFGFFAVALLSGSLAEGLRTADARLEDASHQIADLRAFNTYVVDSLLSGLATTDAAGRVVTFNRAAGNITGLRPAATIGRDIGEVLQLPTAFRAELATLGHTRSLRVDVEHRTEQRGTIEIGLTATTLAFPDGRQGMLFTFQDVTEIKRFERGARLRQRLAAVGEMAAGIAHEIRNPLASMSGSIQVLRQELDLTDEQAQLMDIVLRESARLNDTIRSFLAYARPQRFSIDHIDVTRTLQDTALLLRNSAEVGPDHQIEVDVPGTPVWYDADENQIRQIVWNLATNGLRAMTEGGRLVLAVEDRSQPGGRGEIVLTVRDSGRGIPAEDLDGIFQPFRSSFERGTGLGLAIVHRIVTDYNGTIQVASTVGKGTAMQVHLPLSPSRTASPDRTIGAAAGGVL
jgi:two-component system, NtrC family, sensor histidine kinase PilS